MKIGDKVALIDEPIEGIITSIKGNEAILLTKDGFEMQFPKSDLIIIPKEVKLLGKMLPTPRDFEEKLITKKKKKSVKLLKNRNTPAIEIDLHIHQLVASEKGMSNYDMLNLQLETAKKKLEFAIQNKIQKLVFIHGIGAGVLRLELEYLLNRYEQIKFYDADYQKYGRGALEVYIYQNKKP